jgi:hypothetical protein
VNAEPLVPAAVPALVITGGTTAAATVIASVRESVPLAFEALIVALVVAFMFPSDDRRVKQEAEKLAAYCEAAGGEASLQATPGCRGGGE